MTTRVLADPCDAVTVLARDSVAARHPTLHTSMPQGNHLHGLLLGGLQRMASRYSGCIATLEQLGAVRCRMGRDRGVSLPPGKAFSFTDRGRERRDLGVDCYCQRRGLLAYGGWPCPVAHTKVTSQSASLVPQLVYADGRVRGGHYSPSGQPPAMAADVVVDAGGRGAQAPRWRRARGLQAPAETTLGGDMASASTQCRVPADDDAPARGLVFVGPPPACPNRAVMELMEEHTWPLTRRGRCGAAPPHDAAGCLAFAHALHTPTLHDRIQEAERGAEMTSDRFPTSRQRPDDRLAAFPDGCLVLGDALSSCKPCYGQGRSAAARQGKALQQVLAARAVERHGLDGLAQAVFPPAAEVIVTPWPLAATQDLAYPQTHGARPADRADSAQSFAAFDALTVEDIAVHRLVTAVFHLGKPLSAVHEEPLRSRVLAQQQQQAPA